MSSRDHNVLRSVVFSSPLLPCPSWATISSSASYSRTSLAYVPPSVWQTKFHTHTKQQATFSCVYWIFISLDSKMEDKIQYNTLGLAAASGGWVASKATFRLPPVSSSSGICVPHKTARVMIYLSDRLEEKKQSAPNDSKHSRTLICSWRNFTANVMNELWQNPRNFCSSAFGSQLAAMTMPTGNLHCLYRRTDHCP
jgi:hypothetical protein